MSGTLNSRKFVGRRVWSNNRGLRPRGRKKTQKGEEACSLAASSIGYSIYRAKPLLVVRLESSAATGYKVTRTWLPSLVARRRTVSFRARTVRVCEHRHGHGQHHRRHNQSYRKDHKYALHCLSPPSLRFLLPLLPNLSEYDRQAGKAVVRSDPPSGPADQTAAGLRRQPVPE